MGEIEKYKGLKLKIWRRSTYKHFQHEAQNGSLKSHQICSKAFSSCMTWSAWIAPCLHTSEVTSFQPQQRACCMKHKTAIVSASDFPSKWQWFHESKPKGVIITSSFEVVYKLERQSFLSTFLRSIHTCTNIHNISIQYFPI